MSKIDYQALREAAVAIETVATPQKLLAFRMKVTPRVVLALLDERERNQQYIKRRDQENEDIALTVGKLRVELEAAEKRIAELEAKLETADKLQDSAFRHGLQHGFSFGQTDNQAGFEECLSAYGARGKDNG
ncbi:ead/Ea22-like family protein [Escherichia coli]|nr:ead/Ea22-like family protein [Escherichia coli]MBM2857695.1 ead/Ea22-like family protein [Escherichia coli]